MLFNLLAASAATSTESGDPSTVLLFVLAGVAVLILFAFLASKMFKRQDPENYEEYPLPLDGTNDDQLACGQARDRRDVSHMTNSPDTTLLGRDAALPSSPEEAQLDPVPNPHPDVNYLARFVAPEFTSICPVTGQPDFAHLVIDYCPDAHLVESKSFKLLLGSYRNHGAFHEDCTIDIAKRIIAAVKPRWLRISGYWYPRGGIPIDVFYQTGDPPEGLYVPETGVQPYRGRG